MFRTARSFMNLLLTFSSNIKKYKKVKKLKLQKLQINLFRDEITSMYFNQKAINNVQSNYQGNIMEMTLLLHLMIVLN